VNRSDIRYRHTTGQRLVPNERRPRRGCSKGSVGSSSISDRTLIRSSLVVSVFAFITALGSFFKR
jgi:hypothetical protein